MLLVFSMYEDNVCVRLHIIKLATACCGGVANNNLLCLSRTHSMDILHIPTDKIGTYREPIEYASLFVLRSKCTHIFQALCEVY